MLSIYTDISFVNETYRRQLFPLLFDICILKDSRLSVFYRLVNTPEEADVFVFPINYQAFTTHKKAYHNFTKIIKTHNKPTWVYTSGDFGYTIKEDYYNFRLGGFKSKLNDKTFVLPSFVNDPYAKLNQEFIPLQKDELPKVGFVGHAKAGIKKYLKEFSVYSKTQIKQVLKSSKNDKQAFYPSGYKRATYLNKLIDSELIITNFILRNQYRAGVKTEADKIKTTQEFYENMNLNPYTFCIRGAGNFSVRFYETLAMGRIPVLINTDCKLPLDNSISWNNHACIIDEKDINNMDALLTDFHSKFTDESFEVFQENNRELWLNKLQRVSYFKQIHKQFIA